MLHKKSARITCVFVHGWAMNGAVWQTCFDFLPEWMDVIQVDLPGHGSMADVKADNINDYVQALSALVNHPVIWVGWSLGGLATLQLAKEYPERVAGLFMVASTPCFVQKKKWSCAVDKNVFELFAESLEKDSDATIKRFLALQVKGSGVSMSSIRELQKSLQQRGRASIDALRSGLEILANTDFRDELPYLDCPITWLLGGRDTLVPVTLEKELIALQPNIKNIIEEKAAHAPFISHPENFSKALIEFAAGLR